MEPKVCEQCDLQQASDRKKCSHCLHPFTDDIKLKRAYRQDLADARYLTSSLNKLSKTIQNFGFLIGSASIWIIIGGSILDSTNQMILSAFAIIAFFYIGFGWKANLFKMEQLVIGAIIYTFATILEILIVGLPHRMFPGLDIEHGWVGILPFINNLTPILYLIFRVAIIAPFFVGIYQLQSLNKIADPIKEYALSNRRIN